MKNVRIGGVPEHFNYGWYLALKQGHFKQQQINVRWKDYFGGTGQMTKALRDNEIDMAVILTEGIIKDITEGSNCKIVQVFVESPLIWGIHVAEKSTYKELSDLKGERAAISRFGSGSHLMAYVNALELGWNTTSDLKFEVVKDLDGAVEALTNEKADYFMWEKFTTKPLVDQQIFRRLGDCPTPWPCFVIAVRNEFITNEKETLKTILKVINSITVGFKNIPQIKEIISKRYQQKNEDVKNWLELTEWSQENIRPTVVEAVQNQLMKLDIISEKLPYEQLVANLED
jgi:ABC-type nitrate/sulfonate/bicarbonate transport system substrate-binding protein|tara:strand:- start:3768 stop:4628 length:861 start_codon:yes stop_codon:yes gene_type:complete